MIPEGVRPIRIKNRLFARYAGEPVYDMGDFRKFELSPQPANEHGTLKPQVKFSFANTDSKLYIISIARKMDGSYVFGFDIYRRTTGSGCHPSEHWKLNHPKAETLQKCLINALNYMRRFEFYYGKPDKDVQKEAASIQRIIRRKEIRQMTIFDLEGV